MIKIATIGAASSANKGAGSMLQAVIDNAPERFGPVRVSVLSTYPESDRQEPPHPVDGAEIEIIDAKPLLLLLVLFPLGLLALLFSHLRVPKVSLPKYEDWGDVLTWLLREAPPGQFPFTAGVFPLKRENEDPARMFAGEGGPERTNRRFHYVSRGLPAKRLSTAFDSVTLYGEDPDHRPDIYGKVGNSGVSIANVDDAKKLYSGFDLADPTTSVSMTINGPAPMLLGFFLNAAGDEACEKRIHDNHKTQEFEEEISAQYAKRGV